jgi:uncharacterized damage-inducible protein DinB
MNKQDIQLLFDYNRWANARLGEAASALNTQQFIKDLASSHRSVRDTLVHILSGEWIWLQRWQGQSPKSMFDPAAFPCLAALRTKWAEVEREQMNFVHNVTEFSLKKIIAYENLQGETWRYPLQRMMQHLANHSTYHRGQVTTMLRQLGAEPAATDFLVFLDMQPEYQFEPLSIFGEL